MYHVMDLTSPSKVWKKFESQYCYTLYVQVLYEQIIFEVKVIWVEDVGSYLLRLDVKIDDKDKAIILMCSLSNSYEHLVTTLTYEKETISLEEIIVILMSHCQQRQNVGESAQKFKVFTKFKLWKVEVKNQTRRKINCLRFDNGTKYTDSQF
ncbi:hypothetical protein CR513_20431, partial [Mucuna pruriens]